ncbi:MAG: glycosyltransferase family 9 protein [Bdellovibrio sp.]|nr:glycosyltransferase family 9 protein [Bdellovibrio sp.]
MKILVVSLLRLGDIIQQEPLLRGLRAKYPHAEIHMLINQQFASVQNVLPGLVDRYFFFDRESLQRGLGEAAYNILWSYSQLERLVQELSQEKYDQVLNFTHNKLSAYLVGAIEAPTKEGLYQQDGRFQGLENRWLCYFNDRFSGVEKSLFHYVELLGNSFDIPVAPQVSGERKKSKLVLLQCLTSDVKKNWGLMNYRDLKETIEATLVDYEVCVLGAPFERETLSQVFGESDLLICDLAEAKEHLQHAALLVTGDTSIKHLAAQLGTPIVELALGSSDWTKTSAFSQNAEVLTGNVPCAPCGHSQSCSKATHLCAEQISVDRVFTAVWDQLSGKQKIPTLNARELERTVWGTYLNKSHKDVEPFYADIALKFVTRFDGTAVRAEMSAWQSQSQVYNTWLAKIEKALPAREVLQKKTSLQSSEVADLIMCAQEILKSGQDQAGYFKAVVEALTTRFAVPVQIYDRVHAALEQVRELLEVRNNIVRYLEIVSKEGAYYATGIGQLPISGFEEARTGLHRSYEDADL